MEQAMQYRKKFSVTIRQQNKTKTNGDQNAQTKQSFLPASGISLYKNDYIKHTAMFRKL